MEYLEKKAIQLSDHFTYKKIARFTIPSIAMMIFMSIYGVVDGFFVSNYVGGTEFAALNLIMPYIMIFGAVGLMFGTGGSALVAFILGTGDKKKANEVYSLIVYILIALGLLFMVIGIVFARPMSILLGADEGMLPHCVLYARVCFLGAMPFTLQFAFQSFFVTAEKPRLGLYITVAAGVTNMFLDWLLVGVLRLGLAGAAAATDLGMAVGGIIPVIYFACPNSSLLRLGKMKWYGRELFKAAGNGASEFMSNISMSIVNMLYNLQLMKYAGERGVSAYGIIMYTNFIFIGYFVGYGLGIAPVIGFNHGANNRDELKNVYGKSMKIVLVSSALMMGLSMVSARVLALIFASADIELLNMTINAIRIYSICYLFTGVNIFGSAFFTALNNGKISALISFMRVLVFQVLFLTILPRLFALNGIWFSIVSAECCAVILTFICLWANRKRYQYV